MVINCKSMRSHHDSTTACYKDTNRFTAQMNDTFGSGEIYYRWEHDPCRRQITAGISVCVKEIQANCFSDTGIYRLKSITKQYLKRVNGKQALWCREITARKVCGFFFSIILQFFFVGLKLRTSPNHKCVPGCCGRNGLNRQETNTDTHDDPK